MDLSTKADDSVGVVQPAVDGIVGEAGPDGFLQLPVVLGGGFQGFAVALGGPAEGAEGGGGHPRLQEQAQEQRPGPREQQAPPERRWGGQATLHTNFLDLFHFFLPFT